MRTTHLLVATTVLLGSGAAFVLRSRSPEPERHAVAAPSSRNLEPVAPAVPVTTSRPASEPRPLPFRKLARHSRTGTWTDELDWLRTASPQSIHFGRHNRPEAVLLREGGRGTVTFTPWPAEAGSAPAASLEVAAGARPFTADLFYASLAGLELEEGDYEVRVDGRPCFEPRRLQVTPKWLFVRQPAEVCSLVVTEHVTGCFTRRNWIQSYSRSDDGFVAADGTRLSGAEVDELRTRVFASRPRPSESANEILAWPDAYLESLGFTDEAIAKRVPEIRRLCVGDWKDTEEKSLEIPPELDELFELHRLKRALVDYLLLAPDRSTTTYSTQIEIPGDPWIHLSNSSCGPDLIPWYVVADGERWYLLDRELSQALADLGREDGWMRQELADSRDWRETIWSSTVVWRKLRKRTDEALARVSYKLVPGWDAIEARFEPGQPTGQRRDLPALASMTLRVREAGTIDEVLLRPEHDDLDWNDVLAGYGLAEELASTQPWLARWKEKSGGRIAVFLPAGIHDLYDRHSILELWEEVALGGTPELALSFGLTTSVGTTRKYFNGGLGVLSTDGTLMILKSSGTHGPLAGVAPPGTTFRGTGHYGLVLPGGDLEVRVREQ